MRIRPVSGTSVLIDSKASSRRSGVNSVSVDFQLGRPAWRSTDLTVKIDKEKKDSEKVK